MNKSVLKSLYIEKYKGFKDFVMNFDDKLTVLVGENGTGKTTILEIIYNILSQNSEFFKKDEEFTRMYLEIYINDELRKIEVKRNNEDIIFELYGNESIEEKNTILTKQNVLYFKAEVNFTNYELNGPSKLEIENTNVMFDAEKMSKELKQFLINQKYQDLNDIANGNINNANRIESFKKIYNEFLEDKEFIGIDNDNFEPLFKLKNSGENITIEELSSGEKQIFFKGGTLLQYAKDKQIVVLIDEPEISMHPEWQQKILKFYRNINSNIQFVFATHSPHIVSCCKSNEIRLIEKMESGLQIKEVIEGTYGVTNEELLFSIFNLKTVRNIDVQKEMDEYKELYIKRDALSPEEFERMNFLKERLLNNSEISKSDMYMLNFHSDTERYRKILKNLGGKNA